MKYFIGIIILLFGIYIITDLALKTITELLGFADDYTEFNGWYSHREHMVDEFFTENNVDMRFIYRRNQSSQNSF